MNRPRRLMSGSLAVLIGAAGALSLLAGAASGQTTDDQNTPRLPPMTPQQKAAVEAALKVRAQQKKAATTGGGSSSSDPNAAPVGSTPGGSSSPASNGQPTNPPASNPGVSTPPVSQPPVTMPKVAPMKIVKPPPVYNNGFSRPYAKGFSYQGPRYFTRPFGDGVRFNDPPARELPTRPDRRPTPTVAPVETSLPTLRPDLDGGWGRYSWANDPFSTRYPITETFHTTVDSYGRIRSFTTVNPVTGYPRSYNAGEVNNWDILRYSSDRFRMRAMLRNGFLYDPFRAMPRCCSSGVYITPGGTIEDWMAAPPEIVSEPQTPSAEPPADPIEEARLALSAGRAEMALPRLREALMLAPDDLELRRVTALTLIMNRDVPQGIAELAGVYATDPGLAAIPLDYQKFNIRGSALTDSTNRLVSYGKRNQDPLAYFAAAVIQQARGEMAPARKMLELAIKAGLDRELASAMSGALAPAAR